MTVGDLEREFYLNQDQVSLVLRSQSITPGAGTGIAVTGNLPAGVYEIEIIARYGAVPDIMDNMVFLLGGANQFNIPVLPVANGVPIPIKFNIRVNGSQFIGVASGVAAAAGAVYIAHLIATKIGD